MQCTGKIASKNLIGENVDLRCVFAVCVDAQISLVLGHDNIYKELWIWFLKDLNIFRNGRLFTVRSNAYLHTLDVPPFYVTKQKKTVRDRQEQCT